MGAPTDRVFCVACGTIHEEATMLLEQLRRDLDGAERDLRAKRRQIAELRGEQYAQLTASPHYGDAMEVLEDWRLELAPKTKELGGKRLLNVIARLKGGSTVDDLKNVVRGYKLMPYVVNGRRAQHGRPGEKKVDAELIFRDASHVDQGIAWVEERQQEQLALTHVTTPPAPRGSANGSGRAERIAAYTDLGFAVFPCVTGKKVPATPEGFHNATRDRERIIAYWTKMPHANVAVATGAISAVVVIDLDVDVEVGIDGRDSMAKLEAEYEELPETLTAITPRKGTHLYFRHPGVDIHNAVGVVPGLDVRGDGGYVLLPDSTVAGQPYEFTDRSNIAPLPQWLLQMLLELQRKSLSADLKNGRDWAAFITVGATQGERDTRMTKAVGHLYRQLPADGQRAREVMAWAKVLNGNVRPPLDLKDLERIVKSIGRAEARRR